MKDKYKHFIIVGAQRSGSTFLYKILDKHLQICMNSPIVPEPKYFLTQNTENLNINDYRDKFFGHCDERNVLLLGEKSTSYYENEKSAYNISTTVPDAKIIFILRNPIQRALSNFFFSKNNGIESRSIEDVFLKKIHPPIYSFKTSVNPFNYLERGLYINYINLYKKYFKDSEVYVVILEELINEKQILIDLYDFLGIKKDNVPNDYSQKINSSKRNEVVSMEILKSLGSYYDQSILNLEDILNKDLSIWR